MSASVTQSFLINPLRLPGFLSLVNQHDDMGGNEVVLVKDCGEKILVVVRREFSYPYITDMLSRYEQGRHEP